jgi:hypothetical protein
MFTESPLIQELRAEDGKDYVVDVLQSRFVNVPLDVVAALRTIQDLAQLRKLLQTAAVCPDLETFRAAIVDATKSS